MGALKSTDPHIFKVVNLGTSTLAKLVNLPPSAGIAYGHEFMSQLF